MTTRSVHGCYYHFFLRGQQLAVIEVHRQPAHPTQPQLQLQLLDAGHDSACEPWGTELPARLRLMHSHWICRCGSCHTIACCEEEIAPRLQPMAQVSGSAGAAPAKGFACCDEEIAPGA